METEMMLLKKSLMIQAKFFLDDAGEFYPFAAAIGRKDDVKSIGVYLENEHPSSGEVLTVLEKAIDKGLSNGDYKIAAIGLDVFLPSDGGSNRKSAMEIRIVRKGNDVITTYIPYHEEDNKYFFDDVLSID